MKFSEIVSALRAKAHALACDKVSASETERRISVCSGCERLQVPRTTKQKAAITLSGGEFVCGVCDCGVELLCVTKDELLPKHSAEEEKKKPDYCWMP